ncbi:MAG TPA: dethiobiotin synthase [Acidimicrobiales bacterium]|jgi:dethiobiotin synthetase
MPGRPDRTVVVIGTGTDVGKTWVTAALARRLVDQGVVVAARKPAQSFAPEDRPEVRDAAVLGAATGEAPEVVCPPHRSYAVPLAPPMAAAVLGRPPIALAELLRELAWPDPCAVGLVETVGGVRSPISHDADGVALIEALAPDLVLLVADAGLGTINLVRLTLAALAGPPVVTILNRFDPADPLHRDNLSWLRDRDGRDVVSTVDEVVDRLG